MIRKKTYKQHKQRKKKERDGKILEIVKIAKYPKKEEMPPLKHKVKLKPSRVKSFDKDRKKQLKSQDDRMRKP